VGEGKVEPDAISDDPAVFLCQLKELPLDALYTPVVAFGGILG
jgi:hypothetical protein